MKRRSAFGVATFVAIVFGVVQAKNLDNVDDSANKKTAGGCENVVQFFSLKNISVYFEDGKGSICNGQCCDEKTESLLRKQGQKDFAALLRHNSRSLQGLLASTANTLQNHVLELAHQSENKTLVIFGHVYRGMSGLAREPIELLYRDIRRYLQINSTEAKPEMTPEEIASSVNSFFKELFPLAYHHSAGVSNTKDFTGQYKDCLRKSLENILPFGEVPKQIAQSLSKSLEATRLLLQAFKIGAEVLNTTDTLLIDEHGADNSQCHDALVKMTYCPKCLGLWKHTKPCSGYCLNVLRGCITKYVAELDLPWNGYVEGIESLLNAVRKSNNDAGVNVDAVIRNLDSTISSAIMNYLSKAKDIDVKVKTHCGTAEFLTIEDQSSSEIGTPPPTMSTGGAGSGGGSSKPRSANSRSYFAPLPENELAHFLNAIAKTKGFYANLATTLCQDASFAEPKDRQCWNGERIAEYTKTVVDVGLDMQKYNPEVKPSINTQSVDPKVAGLVDKLRRVHHMAVSSLGPNYLDADYMQRDGTDGSGSGGGSDFEEDDRDDEYVRGSGSGDGPGGHDGIANTHDEERRLATSSGSQPTSGHKEPTPPKATGRAAGNTASYFLLLVATSLLLLVARN